MSVSLRGDASGQQQFGEQTGRQESMRASAGSTLLQVCSYLMGDGICDVTLCSSVFASGEPHCQVDHPDYVPCVFSAVYKQAKKERIREGKGIVDSSREGLDRHCRSH